MIEGLAWMAVANAGLLLASHAVLRRIRTEKASINGVLFILVHLLLVSVAVLLAGVSGGLTARALGLAGGGLLAVLLLLGEHRHVRLPSRPEIGRPTAVLLAAIVVRLLLQVWFLAPANADVLSYHLTKVAEWVQAGRFTRELGCDFCAPFPAGFELTEAWWTVFLHHDLLIEMAGVEFAVLAFLAVRLLGESLSLSSKSSFLAAALYLLTPTFALQNVSCLNDAPVAALTLALAAMTAARAHPLLLVLPLGLSLGTKATGSYAVPGWILLAFLLRRDPVARPGSGRTAAAVALAALGVASVWYVRNTLWFGSPVYPLKRGDLTYLEQIYYIQVGPKLESLWINLREFVAFLIGDDLYLPTPISWKAAGWGVIPYSIGVLALVQEIRRDLAFRRVAAAFGVAMLVVLLMVKPDPWYGRFILFVPALMCVAAAKMAESVRPAGLILAAEALFEFASTLLPHERTTAEMVDLVRMPWRQRSAAAMAGCEAPGSPVGVYASLRIPSYLFYGPDFSRRVVYFRIPNLADLPAEMERQGVRVVYIHIYARLRFDLDQMVREGRLRALGGKFYGLP